MYITVIFSGSNSGEVDFLFCSSFSFLLSRECDYIEGCCLCCRGLIIFVCKLACMAVNNTGNLSSCYYHAFTTIGAQ